jgi:hypothetical protein
MCSGSQSHAHSSQDLGPRVDKPTEDLGPHARSPSRICLHLVLVPLKLSVVILISKRFLSRKGDWSNVDGTPITQCP